MLAWLKLLNPKVWIALAAFILFASYTGAVYHAGGVGPAETHLHHGFVVVGEMLGDRGGEAGSAFGGLQAELQ